MSFWRKEVVETALSHETRRQMEEQRAWIEREPSNPRPYYHLAQFYRMEARQEEALGLLLEGVRLDANFAEAQVALAEIYAVRADYAAAWRHARLAERNGDPRAVELLTRHGISSPGES
jgi:thioredoxin-like negative regulator of GroEL